MSDLTERYEKAVRKLGKALSMLDDLAHEIDFGPELDEEGTKVLIDLVQVVKLLEVARNYVPTLDELGYLYNNED